MAADSAGCTVTTVVTCEGDLSDPGFLSQFDLVLDKLQGLLGEPLKVHKLEPWNSVRVTLSIPREAALRLRQLANDGSQQLRALGILSVQVEGDQVISLRLAGTATSEPREIILRTGQDGSPASTSGTSLSQLLAGPSEAAVPTEKVQFRSPNVVCPPDTIVPKVPVPSTANASTPPTPTKGYAGPFPFTSMNQAMHSSRDTNTNVAAASTTVANGPSFTAPPPPYPGKHPPVTLSSPLLVNLLQNEGGTSAPSRTVNPPPPEPTECVQTVATVTTTQRLPSAFAVNKTLPVVRTPQIAVNTTINNIQPSISALNSVTAAPHSNNSKVMYVNNIQNNVLPRQVPKVPKEVPNNIVASSPNSLTTTAARNPVPYLYPPPYPNTTVNTTRQWEQTVQPMPQLQELVPTLADLKADDLDHLLPSLERELASSPLNLPEFLSDSKSRTVFLINPLTGELEPQSHSDSEEEVFRDVFTGLPSPANLSDEDTNSTIRPDTTDQSDSESRSCHSDSSKHSKLKIGRSREKGRDSPNINKPTEKIKLRLKLEKSEPVSPAYKVDVSFINTPQPKKAVTGTGEELRVPPLHISLRGRNHVVINNKKKLKLNPDGTPVVKAKPKKMQDHTKVKKDEDMVQQGDITSIDQSSDYSETRKLKKPKLNHDSGKDKIQVCPVEVDNKKELLYNNLHYTEKLMLRRGSDSELARNSKKYLESNGIMLEEKKRRLSQTEDNFDHQQPSSTPILGSTNTGTVTSIANHKARKEKFKFKENFKSKDLNRFKSYSKNIAEKLNNSKQIPLPTGEIDMEAKFKQRLMEDQDRIVPCIPHRTEMVIQKEPEEKLIQTLEDPPALKDKPPEPDKCNTPDRKPDLQDKQPNRSPNSGAQGEDSGIESMDALSEKSPNQASQSPHAEIPEPIKSKTQVPDILDIEAQLAKMEGLHGEDLNENHSSQTKLEQCCVLTTALQDSLSKGTVTLTQHTSPGIKEQMPQLEVSIVPLKSNKPPVVTNKDSSGKGDDLEPLPLRVTPPLYTYSNPEKRSTDSPTLSDSDSNLCNPLRKSLLEQLLIEIPENPTPSSPSPATRSVRTRASSKMNSPELNSPVVANNKSKTVSTTKRKRNESDSSNHSLEEQRNKKPRKCSENAAELIKACMGVEALTTKTNSTPPLVAANKKKVLDESSDSDEPLIEVAGKVRKSTQTTTPAAVGVVPAAASPAPAATTRVKLKANNTAATTGTVPAAAQPGVKAASVNTRRSIRTMPVINTRSKGDKSNPDSDVIRRKTRSAVSEGEGKRRKDIK